MEMRTDHHLLANERAVEDVWLDPSSATLRPVEVAGVGHARVDHARAGLVGPVSEGERRCNAPFFAEHSIESLARRSDAWLSAQGRLTQPMYRPPDGTHYQPISWDEAFAVLARHLRETTPERTAFYTSNRTSNEASFLYHLFVREYGTNNLPDCTNMCHESSGQALHETIGIDKGTVPLDEFAAAQVILVIGQNPGLNNPKLATALERAKAAGASIVAINPLPPAGHWQLMSAPRARMTEPMSGEPESLADRFLQIRVGGDLALFQLINAGLIERGAVDTAFVDEFCSGYDALHDALESTNRSALLEATGLTANEVDSLTGLLAGSDRIVACWAMGLTQQRDAVAAIREVVNTLLLRGSFGAVGAGIGPVRGHSHVHGGRTPGLYNQADQTFFDALDTEFGLSVPRHPGHDTVGSIAAMRRRDIDVFMAMGGNFAGAAPDTDATADGLRSCQLTVQVSTKLNRSHVMCGREALILPALSQAEVDRTGGVAQFVTAEDTTGEVHTRQGRAQPISPQLKSEVAIVCGLAQAVQPRSPVPWASFTTDYALIRQRIERVLPAFAAFERRVAGGGSFRLPNPPRDIRSFPTTTGRARLTVNSCEPIDIPERRLLLQTLRSRGQFNTVIHGGGGSRHPDERRTAPLTTDAIAQAEAGPGRAADPDRNDRRVVFVHPDDVTELGFVDGAFVDLVSEWSDGDRRAQRFRIVAYPLARRTAAAYFPEANVLVPLGSVAEGSNTPTSKGIIIRLEQAGGRSGLLHHAAELEAVNAPRASAGTGRR